VPRRRLSREALAKLQHYDFPGNARELRNLIERASILSVTDPITEESLPLPSDVSESSDEGGGRSSQDKSSSWIGLLPEVDDLRTFLTGVEKEIILRTLKSTGGAQAEAARRLGLSRSDLGYKLAKFGIRGAEE